MPTHTLKERAKGLTSTKARKILRDGSVRGNPLTKKQKGFLGAKAGGNRLSRLSGQLRKKG